VAQDRGRLWLQPFVRTERRRLYYWNRRGSRRDRVDCFEPVCGWSLKVPRSTLAGRASASCWIAPIITNTVASRSERRGRSGWKGSIVQCALTGCPKPSSLHMRGSPVEEGPKRTEWKRSIKIPTYADRHVKRKCMHDMGCDIFNVQISHVDSFLHHNGLRQEEIRPLQRSSWAI